MINRWLMMLIFFEIPCFAAADRVLQREIRGFSESTLATRHVFKIVGELIAHSAEYRDRFHMVAEIPQNRFCSSFTEKDTDTGKILISGKMAVLRNDGRVVLSLHSLMSREVYEEFPDQHEQDEFADGLSTRVEIFANLPDQDTVGVEHRVELSIPLFRALIQYRNDQEVSAENVNEPAG